MTVLQVYFCVGILIHALVSVAPSKSLSIFLPRLRAIF